MTGESGVGSKPIKVSMANQKSRAAAGSGQAQVGGLDMGGRGHQNGSNGSWGSPLDGPMGTVSGPGGSATPARGGGADSGWPGVQSQPTAAATAAAWNQPTAATHIAAAAATHPDFSTYQHYYSQYAQQFSQQQQQYAAAWSAWQQQQPWFVISREIKAAHHGDEWVTRDFNETNAAPTTTTRPCLECTYVRMKWIAIFIFSFLSSRPGLARSLVRPMDPAPTPPTRPPAFFYFVSSERCYSFCSVLFVKISLKRNAYYY